MGASIEADAVVAADGVHSFVKEQLFGKDETGFTGRIAYRTVFPAALAERISRSAIAPNGGDRIATS